MTITRAQKIEALSNFLEYQASARVDGHSGHDGRSCPGHIPAFEGLAGDLLELIEESFGYADSTEASNA